MGPSELSHLCSNLGGHWFGTVPGGIEFEHYWTAGSTSGLLFQRKPLVKSCRFLQWKLGPLVNSQKGYDLVRGKMSAHAAISITRHKNTNAQ